MYTYRKDMPVYEIVNKKRTMKYKWKKRTEIESFQIIFVWQKENVDVKLREKKVPDIRYTVWQLYKLNGGINNKIKLNDYTRK